MNRAKPKVMLHYVQAGLNRSPNIQFDRLQRLDQLTDRYDFVMLDQDRRPGDMGNLRLVLDLYRKIRREKPDIIHISGIVEGFHCMIAATLARCRRRIIITHGFTGNLGKGSLLRARKLWLFQRVIEPLTLACATVVQCNSDSSLNQPVVRKYAAKKACTIYNVSPCVEQPDSKVQLRLRLGLAEDDFIFISVGRITRDKGFDDIREAILETGMVPHLSFVIIGTGEGFDELRTSLSAQIAAGRVRLLGSLPNDRVLEWMAASDVFMLPSAFETFGMAYVEAAFNRLPSIAVDQRSISAIIRNNETGILIQLHNEKALVNAMLKFYKNPVLAAGMGENAYRHAAAHFSNAAIGQAIHAMYARLLAGSAQWNGAGPVTRETGTLPVKTDAELENHG